MAFVISPCINCGAESYMMHITDTIRIGRHIDGIPHNGLISYGPCKGGNGHVAEPRYDR